MSDGVSLTVVDLFAGAGGLSQGTVEAIVDAHAEDIAADTGLRVSDVDPDHVRVQVWLGEHVELHAVNHWEPAITTHEQNHPWAHHYHARIEELYPPDVVDPGEVDLLTGGPECTHFSNARGGKPVSDQKRASAWHVLDWIEKLRPEHVLLENVTEFRDWGPIDDDGQATKDGSIFEQWIGMLETFGYSVVYDQDAEEYGVVLNAADYGDPQSRERLFIMASRDRLPTKPPRTHADEDDDDDLPGRRPAADIIDWSDLGDSLWTRDLENPRVQPLAENTMERIAEGIRRHCSPRLAAFADAIERIGPSELEALRDTAVPAEYASLVADAVDEPFLVHTRGRTTLAMPHILGQHSNSVARDVQERPSPTVATGGKLQLATPAAFCLRQQSGGTPLDVDGPLSTVSGRGAISLTTVESRALLQPRNGQYGDDAIAYDPEERSHHTVIASDPRQGHLLTPSLVRYSHGGRALPTGEPMPTVATEKGGTFAQSQPFLCPMYNPRAGQLPRTRTLGRPLGTVLASKSPAGLAVPFIDDVQGAPRPATAPLNTQPGSDRFALVVPEAWPWGLDVHYRMLEPDELKQAQGFPADYEITGSSKKCRTKQIGNAVPVNLARSLVAHLLRNETPSLSTYGGGHQAEADVDVPAYEEVASDD